MADPRSILDPLGVDTSVKADAWDAFNQASSPADFQARFDKLGLPTAAKASLWDLKFSQAPQVPGAQATGLPPLPAPSLPSTLAPAAPAPARPVAPQGAPSLAQPGSRLPSAQEADAMTSAYVQQVLAGAPMPTPALPGQLAPVYPTGGSAFRQQYYKNLEATENTSSVATPESQRMISGWGSQAFPPMSPQQVANDATAVLPIGGQLVPVPLGQTANATGRFLLNQLSPDSLVKMGIVSMGAAGVPALANTPVVVKALQNLPEALQGIGLTPQVALRAANAIANAGPGLAVASKGAVDLVSAGVPKNYEQGVETTLNALMLGAGMAGAVAAGKSAMRMEAPELGVKPRATPNRPSYETGVKSGAATPEQVAGAQATAEDLAAKGQNLAAADWRIAAEQADTNTTRVKVGDQTYTINRQKPDDPEVFKRYGYYYELRDPNGQPVPSASGTAPQVEAWLQRHIGGKPNPEGGGSAIIGNGSDFEGGAAPVNVSRSPAGIVRQAPATTPGVEGVERYQLPSPGAKFGKQQEVRPLDEPTYNQFVAPRLKAPITWDDYRDKYPDATHVRLTRTGDGWEFAGAGAAEDLRPNNALQVESFDSEEALRHGSPQPSKVTPISKRGQAAIDLTPSGDSPIPKPALKPLANTDEDQFTGHVLGDATQVKTSRGDVYNAQWAVVPSAQNTLSHDLDFSPNPLFPPEAQPRDRERAASRVQRDEIARDLDFKELSDSYHAAHGAPLALPNTVRISGNLRGNAVRYAYENGLPSAARYRADLLAGAPHFGLDADAVAKVPNPELVRIMRDRVDDLHGFAIDANKDTVAAMSDTEQASADAKQLTGPLMSLFHPGEDGTIVHAGNRDFIRSFFSQVVSPAESNRYQAADGTISQAGVQRIRNAVFARAYGDGGALEKLAESPDAGARNVTLGMLQAAGQFTALHEAIQKGDVHDLSIAPDANAAAAKLSDLRASGMDVGGYLKQGALWTDMTPEARALLSLFDRWKRSPKRIGGVLRNYARGVEALGSPKQAGMFGSTLPTKSEILEAAARRVESDYGDEQSGRDVPDLFTQQQTPDGGTPVPQNGAAESGRRAAEESRAEPAAAAATPREVEPPRAGLLPSARPQPRTGASTRVTGLASLPAAGEVSVPSSGLAPREDVRTEPAAPSPAEAAAPVKRPGKMLVKSIQHQATKAEEKVHQFNVLTNHAPPEKQGSLQAHASHWVRVNRVLVHIANGWIRGDLPAILQPVGTADQVDALLSHKNVPPAPEGRKPGHVRSSTPEERLWQIANEVEAETPEKWTALRAAIQPLAKSSNPAIALDFDDWEKRAQRATEHERDKTPLFSDQIPETKPEQLQTADDAYWQRIHDMKREHETKAGAWRAAVEGAVTPDELAAMDTRVAKLPDTPTYRADFWRGQYRETFGFDPDKEPAGAGRVAMPKPGAIAPGAVRPQGGSAISPGGAVSFPQHAPNVDDGGLGAMREELAGIWPQIKALMGQLGEVTRAHGMGSPERRAVVDRVDKLRARAGNLRHGIDVLTGVVPEREPIPDTAGENGSLFGDETPALPDAEPLAREPRPKPVEGVNAVRLSGSRIDGRVSEWANVFDVHGNDVAHVTVRKDPGGPVTIAAKLAPAYAAREDADNVRRWVEFLARRAYEGKPSDVAQLRTWMDTARDKWMRLWPKSNRANISRHEAGLARAEAYEAEARYRELAAQYEDLTGEKAAKLGGVNERPIAQPAADETPAPAAESPDLLPGTTKLFDRLVKAIRDGEDIRLRLEKIAEEVLGGSRAQGTFQKQDLYEIQEAALNRVLSERAGELLSMPFAKAAAELRAIAGRLATQTVRSDEKIRLQQFSTPPQLALLVDRTLRPTWADTVLEPSAGTGNLVAMLKGQIADVWLNEIDPRRAALARLALGIPAGRVTAVDGENANALLDTTPMKGVRPTAVVMNPPFSAGVVKSNEARNDNRYGMNHVEQALQRLADGGRAVIILGGGQKGGHHQSNGADLTASTFSDFWQRLASRYHIRANVRIDGSEYRKQGTDYATRVIVIDKDGATPGANWLDQLATVERGDYDTVEAAWEALQRVAETRPLIPQSGVADVPRGAPERGGELPGGNAGAVRPGGPVAGSGIPGNATPRPGGSSQSAAPGGPGSGSRSPRAGAPGHENAGAPNGQGAPRSSADAPPQQIAIVRRDNLQPEEDAGAFVLYEPSIEGPQHPGAIVETKTMSTIPLPPLNYRPMWSPTMLADARVSAVQMEAAVMAGMQNEIVLPNGARAAALIGDGTGVGKGREAGAILLDNWHRGRRRLLWVSEKWDLDEDARRDLRGIGADDMLSRMKRLDQWDAGKTINHDGPMFATYSMLRSENKQNQRRIDQVEKWLRGDGSAGLDGIDGAYIVWDEAHNLKNTVPSGTAQASKTGTRVKALLDENKGLRMAFMSATAASEIQNMGYLDRLGLWGPRTAFPNGFLQFAAEVGSQGLSGMELVARELKAQGKYIARTLSFKGVNADEKPVRLNDDQKAIYEHAADAWADLLKHVDAGIETTNGGRDSRSRFMSQFYSSAQRFFNLLITAFKTPAAIETAQQALDEGRAPVISLVNTSESIQKRQEQRLGDSDDDVDDLDFGPADILVNLVKDHFPVQQYKDDVTPDGKVVKVAMYTTNAEGQKVPVINPAAVAQREALVKQLESELRLPGNPLDLIIDHFGAGRVAELTGREKRWDAAKGDFISRGDKNTPRKKVNIVEAKAFQDGKKEIAVLSNAAGTGISLHADLNAKNQKQREHITLQFGWSADKQMQMYGRTHRTNEASPPHYTMLVSDLAGEKRFMSTIAKRLKSLGALTRGSKDASGGTEEMANLDLDSRQGRQASVSFYNRLLGGATLPGTEMNGLDLLTRMGVVRQTATGPEVSNPDNVNRLLNRLLMLKPAIQNAAFDFYHDIFEAAVRQAIADGSLDTGVKELKGERVTVQERRSIAKDPDTGAETFYYPVQVETRRELMDPARFARLQKDPDLKLYRDRDGKLAATVAAKPITHASGQQEDAVYVYSPESRRPEKVPAYRFAHTADLRQTAESDAADAKHRLPYAEEMVTLAEKRGSSASRYLATYQKDLSDIQAKLADAERRLADYETWAREQWEEQYNHTPHTVTEEHHLVGGAVLKHWGVLKSYINGVHLAQDTATKDRVVGARVEAGDIQQLLRRIQGSDAPVITAGQIWNDVMTNGTPYQLEGGVRVVRGRIGGRQVIELKANETMMQTLTRMGAVYERGAIPRVYVPDSVEGRGLLGRIVQQFKALATDTSGSAKIDFLTLGLASALRRPAGPHEDYSVTGDLKDRFVRNLAQTEQASPKVYREAIRTASSRGQVAVMLRSAVSAIARALERNGGPSWTELRTALIESRLRGIRDRWERMSEAVMGWSEKQLAASFEHGNMIPLLEAVAGEHKIPDNVAEHAAGLLESQQLPGLQRYLRNIFVEAAAHTARVMEPDEFDRVTEDPGFAAGLGEYKRLIEKVLADAHARNEGIFSNALGPLDTYYPLIPVREVDPLGAAIRARTPFRKPRNMQNEFATGQALHYDAGMDPLRAKLESAIKGNNKAALIQSLVDEGLIAPLRMNETAGATMIARGREFRAATIEIGGGWHRQASDGRLVYQPIRQAVVPAWLKRELRPILDRDDVRLSNWRSVLNAINAYSLVGPLDFAWHSANLVGTLVSNTPYLAGPLANGATGSGLTARALTNLPFTKLVRAVLELIHTDPMDNRAAGDLRNMADLGLVPDKFGSETYSRTYAEATGAKVRRVSFGPMLYGPKGIDVRARLTMYRLAKQLDPDISDQDLYRFVNQLGNYVWALQGEVERALKGSGLAPFYTAGSTMYRNGIHAALGTGPIPGPNTNRLWQQLTGGLIGAVALWYLVHRAVTGKWPQQMRDSRLLEIPVPGSWRETALGRALWGQRSGRAYINLAFFSPLVARGLRGLGLQDAYETHQLGGSAGQVFEHGLTGILNAAVSPVTTSPVVRAGTILATGHEPHLTGIHPIDAIPAVRRTKPGLPMIGARGLEAALTLNGFVRNVGGAAGLGHKASEADRRGNSVLAMVLDLAFPRLIAPVSNENGKANWLHKERRRTAP